MTTFLDWPYSEDGKHGRTKSNVCVVGIPSDLGSSTNGGGQAEGPRAIRWSYALDGLFPNCVDAGDIIPTVRDIATFNKTVEQEVRALAPNTNRLIVFGGDDSINIGVVRGMNVGHLVHLDAHSDDYPAIENETDHATWIADLRNTVTVHQYGVRVDREPVMAIARPSGPFWLAVDIDVLDPAYAPGVNNPEPFGMSARELRDIVCRVVESPHCKGVSFTELNPARDINMVTARTIAKLAILVAQVR